MPQWFLHLTAWEKANRTLQILSLFSSGILFIFVFFIFGLRDRDTFFLFIFLLPVAPLFFFLFSPQKNHILFQDLSILFPKTIKAYGIMSVLMILFFILGVSSLIFTILYTMHIIDILNVGYSGFLTGLEYFLITALFTLLFLFFALIESGILLFFWWKSSPCLPCKGDARRAEGRKNSE